MNTQPEIVTKAWELSNRIKYLEGSVEELLIALITARNALGQINDGLETDIEANLIHADAAIKNAE